MSYNSSYESVVGIEMLSTGSCESVGPDVSAFDGDYHARWSVCLLREVTCQLLHSVVIRVASLCDIP